MGNKANKKSINPSCFFTKEQGDVIERLNLDIADLQSDCKRCIRKMSEDVRKMKKIVLLAESFNSSWGMPEFFAFIDYCKRCIDYDELDVKILKELCLK